MFLSFHGEDDTGIIRLIHASGHMGPVMGLKAKNLGRVLGEEGK